jgi:hypothetical protein
MVIAAIGRDKAMDIWKLRFCRDAAFIFGNKVENQSAQATSAAFTG